MTEPPQAKHLSLEEALACASALSDEGQLKEAEGLCRGVLMHEPKNFEAMTRLGAVLVDQKKLHEALYWFWRARKINRKHPTAVSNYAMVVSELGHPEEAIDEFRKAAILAERMKDRVAPQAMAMYFNNLGNTLERVGRYPEALVALDKAISINPNDSFAHYNRGIVLLRLNRHHEAVAGLNRSLDLDPNNHDARYNRAMARLLLGDLRGGFADYEFRLVTSENKIPNLGLDPALKWNGEDLEGKTILVHAEQGLGDAIQFMRFVPELVRRGAKVLMIAHSAVKPLIDIPGVTIGQTGEDLAGKFDCWVALMSLPMFFGTTEQSIPSPVIPVVEPGRSAHWSRILRKTNGNLNVGVCWAGNFQHKNDKHRSIPLKQFSRIFKAEGCNFVSLQQIQQAEIDEFAEIQKRDGVQAIWLDDFRDTAAAMLNLDIVITVDTAVAHLAGTLGVPTWVLIPAFATDWRWQLNRDDSPWYPTARLIRQRTVGDWNTTLSFVRDELTAKTKAAEAA